MDSDGPPGTKEGPQPHGEPLVFNLVTDVGENLPLKSTSPACVRSTVTFSTHPFTHSPTCVLAALLNSLEKRTFLLQAVATNPLHMLPTRLRTRRLTRFQSHDCTMPRLLCRYAPAVAAAVAARDAHVATIKVVPDQNARGNDPAFAICGAPDSTVKYPQ
jgi:hypothetical protein